MAKHGQSAASGNPRHRFDKYGGSEGRHALTHDIRKEELSNERKMHGLAAVTFESDLHTPPKETLLYAKDIKELVNLFANLPKEILDRLQILEVGSKLRCGKVYLKLNETPPSPFVARGSEIVQPQEYLVPKITTDYILWDQLVDKGFAP